MPTPTQTHPVAHLTYAPSAHPAIFSCLCPGPHTLLPVPDLRPDIVHCHDWQSAPVAWLDHGSAK